MRRFLLSLIFSYVSLHSLGVFGATTALPPSCLLHCVTPFGKILGSSHGVVSYSNCQADCESDQWTTLKLAQEEQTGMKWQCVEYARRWYMQQFGYTFASVDHAYQIWELDSAIQLGTSHLRPWLKFANGATEEKPKVNDLLIYNKEQGVHGHVAVVARVGGGYVYISEQNNENAPWEGKSYARRVRLKSDKQGHYWLKDLGVIGWVRLS